MVGGRGEAATYDAPDEEEADIAKQVQRASERRDGEGEDDEDEEDGDEADAAKTKGASPGAATSSAGKKAAPSAASVKRGKKEAAAAAVVLSSSSLAAGGGIDESLNRCSVTVTLPLHSPKLLMLEIVERVAANTMVRSTANIDKVRAGGGRGSAMAVEKGRGRLVFRIGLY